MSFPRTIVTHCLSRYIGDETARLGAQYKTRCQKFVYNLDEVQIVDLKLLKHLELRHALLEIKIINLQVRRPSPAEVV